MARETAAQLRERVEALEAENAALKQTPPSGDARRAWGRVMLSSVLIVIGALLAPVALVGSWVTVSLTDTERFVATYASLADDPHVQQFVSEQVTSVILEQSDAASLTDNVIDGIIELGTGPLATRALEALKGPAAAGIQSLVQSVVTNFVESDAFSTVWAQALRVSHSQLIDALSGSSTGALVLSGDEIGVQLGPIIDSVKSALVTQGLTFAAAIPAIDRTIVIAHSSTLPTIQLAYQLAVGLGPWLPLIALLFLVGGVVVAARRAVALLWVTVAVAVSMVIVLAALAIGNAVFLAGAAPAVPNDVAGVLFTSVAAPIRSTAIAMLVLAVVGAVATWAVARFILPARQADRWARVPGTP